MSYRLLLASLATVICSSCASIVSHSRWPVVITTMPAGATVSITNRNGQEVYTGVTPATTSLKSGAGFFSAENYTLKFAMPGYDPQMTQLGTSINGWYFGNILFGGLIGLLIVDPATGAMYRLDQKYMQMTLSQTRAELPQLAPLPNGPQIVSIDLVPAALRDKLVRVTPPASAR